MPTALSSVARLFESRKALLFCATLLAALLGYQTIASAQDTLNAKRVSVRGIPVLEHMLFDATYERFFELRFKQVRSYLLDHPQASILNICSDGLFASLAKVQKLPDPYFVSWNFGIDFFSSASQYGRDRLEYVRRERPMVWMCPLTEDPKNLARRYGLRILPDDRSLPVDAEYSWWPYVSYLAVPAEWPQNSVDGLRE
jgi:hypothetical protein